MDLIALICTLAVLIASYVILYFIKKNVKQYIDEIEKDFIEETNRQRNSIVEFIRENQLTNDDWGQIERINSNLNFTLNKATEMRKKKTYELGFIDCFKWLIEIVIITVIITIMHHIIP